MIKLNALLVVRDGMSPVAFHDHWRTVHGPLAAKIRRARSYVQSHRLPWQPEDLPILPHGGCAQVWFDDLTSARGLLTDPDYTENAAYDEDNFHHMDRMAALQTTAYEAFPGEPMDVNSAAVKLMQFVSRSPDASREQFRLAWLAPADVDGRSGELGLMRHERGAAIAETDDDPDTRPFDGVRELWWPDVWCFMASRVRAGGTWDELVSDPVIDPARSGFLVTSEYRVVWPPTR